LYSALSWVTQGLVLMALAMVVTTLWMSNLPGETKAIGQAFALTFLPTTLLRLIWVFDGYDLAHNGDRLQFYVFLNEIERFLRAALGLMLIKSSFKWGRLGFRQGRRKTDRRICAGEGG